MKQEESQKIIDGIGIKVVENAISLQDAAYEYFDEALYDREPMKILIDHVMKTRKRKAHAMKSDIQTNTEIH